MRYSILLILIFARFFLFAQNEVSLKKKMIVYGFNISYFLSKTFDNDWDKVISPNDFENVNFTSKSAVEFELYTKFKIRNKIYLRPNLSFLKNNYIKNSKVRWQGGNSNTEIKELQMNSTIEESLDNFKFILPIGREFLFKKYSLFLEGGVGFNKILNNSNLISYNVLINTQDPGYGTPESFIEHLKLFSPQYKFPFFFRFNAGLDFQIYQSLAINCAAFTEIYYYKRDLYFNRVFPFFYGFSIGLMQVKR